jgi:hypothetical protein
MIDKFANQSQNWIKYVKKSSKSDKVKGRGCFLLDFFRGRVVEGWAGEGYSWFVFVFLSLLLQAVDERAFQAEQYTREEASSLSPDGCTHLPMQDNDYGTFTGSRMSDARVLIDLLRKAEPIPKN